MSKTSISSIVCFDIIDFAKRTASEQKAALAQFNKLLDMAVVDIPKADLQVTHTESGAIVTCNGVLESALEDALFIALTVRDETLGRNTDGEEPLYLLIGINLGDVGQAQDALAGEGLAEIQQIMSFANPNQILVSLAYYEMASKLTLEIAQMFEKYDMHAYEHDIYAVRRLNEQPVDVAVTTGDATEEVSVSAQGSSIAETNQESNRWQIYFLPALLAMIMLFVLIRWFDAPTTPPEMNDVATETNTPEDSTLEAGMLDTEQDALSGTLVAGEEDAKSDDQVTADAPQVKQPVKKAKKPVVNKKATATRKQPAEEKQADAEKTEYQSVVTNAKDEPIEISDEQGDGEKSTWQTIKDSLKQGDDPGCTQGEIALNQCK